MIDWDALENYFVEHTDAGTTYRAFAEDITPKLAATNYEAVGYEMIRDRGKSHGWMQKRARYLMGQNPGIYEDADVMYGIIKNRIIESENNPAVSIPDFANLLREFRAYGEILRAAEPAAVDSFEGITRDQVISMMDDLVSQDSAVIIERALESMHEETPK